MLAINNLNVSFHVDSGQLRAVRDVSFEIAQGETVAIVGESGAGKSQVFHALMGLLPANGLATGKISFFEKEILNQPPAILNQIRGKQIGMIFQDPMTALNPYMRIGKQLIEVLEIHKRMRTSEATTVAIEMLKRVHIKQAEQRFHSYPHELSGGMRQRVVIAMALLCQPKLIIADEPTTALDVTVQTEIIRLLKEIHETQKTSIVLITHDLPLVAGLCDRVIVMYAGRIVEMGNLADIFHHAHHPYTQALLAATPQNSSNQHNEHDNRLHAIEGQPPDPLHLPTGCAFNPRCSFVEPPCLQQRPSLKSINDNHFSACFLESST